MILGRSHTLENTLCELNLYASLVSVGSYCVVFDTVIEDLDGVEFADRPSGKSNNPKTAVAEFLKTSSDFVGITRLMKSYEFQRRWAGI